LDILSSEEAEQRENKEGAFPAVCAFRRLQIAGLFFILLLDRGGFEI
jgi:hypothetical protein